MVTLIRSIFGSLLLDGEVRWGGGALTVSADVKMLHGCKTGNDVVTIDLHLNTRISSQHKGKVSQHERVKVRAATFRANKFTFMSMNLHYEKRIHLELVTSNQSL